MHNLYKFVKQIICKHTVVEEPQYYEIRDYYYQSGCGYSKLYCPLCGKTTYAICRDTLHHWSSNYSTRHMRFVFKAAPVYIVEKNLVYERMLDKISEKNDTLCFPKMSILNKITISKEEEIELLKLLEKEGIQDGKGN